LSVGRPIEIDRTSKRILVAGIGNAWMKDDAFGGRVAARLDGVLPSEAAVFDFGTGGLDLAYEAMRGYDALILIDVSRQGGEPGTLYVMDAEPDDLAPISDGEMLSPHGMDPETVLRFVKAVGAWPGKVKVVACEPTVVEEMGLQMSPQVERAVERAVAVVAETVAELLTDAAYVDDSDPVTGGTISEGAPTDA
jgi:hydrogenase maturation protease